MQIMNDQATKEIQIEFKTLAEDAPVMLWLTDINGEIIYSNSRWKEFIGAEKVKADGGNAWYQALHPEDQERCLEVFKRSFSSHRPFEMEYRLKRLDGQFRNMLDTGEPYISEDGKFSGYIGSSADITEQRCSEQRLQQSHQEMELHNIEMALVNKLNSFLQICRTLEETYPVMLHYAQELFPDCAGSIYLLNESKTTVESVVSWSPNNEVQIPVIIPDECWALRQGKPHVVLEFEHALNCQHLQKVPEFGYMCVPIIAQGDMLGMIHLQFPEITDKSLNVTERSKLLESRRRLVYMTADNLALSLVSLKLREALKTQSIRDPLTGLYNRRYMEESLEREYSLYIRNEKSLGVIMLDIDHFKKYNDKFGHDVGDKILSELGNLLKNRLRKSDISCRYGGEEFILILPTAPVTILEQRAEEIRNDISNLSISFQCEIFNEITVSLGVAVTPMHADSATQLVKAADEALYQAKNTGRNKVVIAKDLCQRSPKNVTIKKKTNNKPGVVSA
ncbi:MAG: diguanylate cyclase [Gammaproteobacteria bacterium]|nr:diguanylate cyclase [Gammaproteobacteria bacterium]